MLHQKLQLQKPVKKAGTVTLAFATLAFFSACGSNSAFLAERSNLEAQAWHDRCVAQSFRSTEIIVADSLLSVAQDNWKDGDVMKSQQIAERAVVLYRLGLIRQEKQQAAATLDSAKLARANDEEKRNTYREFLEEARGLRKP